jgi:Tol biopolymer transport system component/pimeloyl-ACP methyl ester carboxylesterase
MHKLTKRLLLIGGILVLLACVLGGESRATRASVTTGVTTRVSVASDGTEGNSWSQHPAISADGRYVAFTSLADNLVSGDDNPFLDVFVHDRQTGETTRVSISSDGTGGNNGSLYSSISSDGRYVAFASYADNLVGGDTNDSLDVFVHDRQTAQTTRVSVASSGEQGTSYSGYCGIPAISADGRYVVFDSMADNLVSGDTNSASDVFVHDRQTGVTSIVSVNSEGVQGNHDSGGVAISADGRYVVFTSYANNLVVGDINSVMDAFVHDRVSGETTRSSVASDGTQSNDGSFYPAISADGRYVAFYSHASNLVVGDSNSVPDIFVHDRVSGETTRVSVASDGTQANAGYDTRPSISADGRFVAFESYADRLITEDTNIAVDVFVHDRQTGITSIVSVNSEGIQGNNHSGELAISADGRYVAFRSTASNLVVGDTNYVDDVFVHDREGIPPEEKTPIILIPGLMGSRLFNAQEEVWANICRVLSSDLGLLKLYSNGVLPAVLDDPAYNLFTVPGLPGILDRLAGTCTLRFMLDEVEIYEYDVVVDDPYYETLIDHFLGKGYVLNDDLWVYPYDWRKDLRGSADGLDTLVEQVRTHTGSPEVNLVGHSQGGMVIRQYIANAGRADKVSQAVILGTPFLGSPMAFGALQDGLCVYDIEAVTGTNDPKREIWCFPSKEIIRDLAPNFPVFNQLLPSEAYFTLKGGGFYGTDQFVDVAGSCPACLSYAQTYTTSLVSNLNTALFADAELFHETLDQLYAWNGVPVHIIGGVGQATIVGFREYPRFAWGEWLFGTVSEPVWSNNGDGIVTALSVSMENSATGINLRGTATLEMFTASHQGLVTDTAVLSSVDSYLGLAQTAATSALAPALDSSMVQVVARGVKAIDVYDAAGNHTGPVAGLDLTARGIPGSAYFQEGEMASVALPGGQSYTLTITPTGLGQVDVSLVRSTMTETLTTLLYTGIPAGESSLIRLTGDPTLVDTLQLDADGTGADVQPIIPSLTVTGTTVVDTTPPSVSIALSGELSPLGWYTGPVTVTLSASDNPGGSGVNRIEYAFANDRQPRLYTGPFVVDPAQVTELYAVAVDQFMNSSEPAIRRIGAERRYLPAIGR